MTTEKSFMNAPLGSPEDRDREKEVKFQGCYPNMPKGGAVNAEKNLEEGIITADTGAYSAFLDKYKEAETLSEGDVDEIYKESIADGVVDHHSIDSFLSSRGVRMEKCATQMTADYSEDILKLIEEKGIKSVSTHQDGDLDSIASSYLIQSLIQNKRLPSIAPELAQVANELDYGRFNVEPDAFAKSLPGIISAIKSELQSHCGKELGEEVFSKSEYKNEKNQLNKEGVARLSEIKTKYESLTSETAFKIFNALNALKVAEGNINLRDNAIAVCDHLPEDVQVLITSGQEKVKNNYQEFINDFEKSDKNTITLNGREFPLIIAASRNPLMFTNLAYTKTPPDTIIAVYAGKGRSGGDMYDIGINPDMAREIDLGEICVALNEAEKEKRDLVYGGDADDLKKLGITPEERDELIKSWESQASRLGMSGPRQVIDKDPTVLVAGGTLIAASRTSFLSEDDFKKVFKNIRT